MWVPEVFGKFSIRFDQDKYFKFDNARVALTRFEDGKQGKILASATHDTKTSSPHREWYQQKSTDIWSGVINCAKVRVIHFIKNC